MPDIIIIDEPELGLHPQALPIVASLIKRLSLQKQFILATQSSSLVDLFETDDMVVVDKQADGTSKFIRPDKQKDITKYLPPYGIKRRRVNN